MNATLNKVEQCLILGEEIFPGCSTNLDNDFTLYPSDLWKNGFSSYFVLSDEAINILKTVLTEDGIMMKVI